jgi:hypothetical protein
MICIVELQYNMCTFQRCILHVHTLGHTCDDHGEDWGWGRDDIAKKSFFGPNTLHAVHQDNFASC